MTVSDEDVWRSAKLIVETHGPNAAEVAGSRYHALVAARDAEGAAVWLRIAAVIASGMQSAQYSEEADVDDVVTVKGLTANEAEELIAEVRKEFPSVNLSFRDPEFPLTPEQHDPRDAIVLGLCDVVSFYGFMTTVVEISGALGLGMQVIALVDRISARAQKKGQMLDVSASLGPATVRVKTKPAAQPKKKTRC